MKIADIYKSKTTPIVSICIAALCIIVTGIYFIVPKYYNALSFSLPIQYPWQFISGLFLHGSPNLPLLGSIGHLLFNLILVLPFGIMVEKIIGSRKFLILSLFLWLINLILFYVIAFVMTPKGETAHGAGISGIAFAYGAIGFCALLQLIQMTKKGVLRQVSFYLLMNLILDMLLMINPFVAGVPSMLIHIAAVIAGVVYWIIERREIDNFLRKLQSQSGQDPCAPSV